MSNFANLFRDSFGELRHLKTLTVAAMLTAVSVALGFFQIPITEALYIRFGFIAIGLIGWMYGPVVGGLCAGISDILCILLVPTNNGAFFFGFTITAILGGVIYGCVFYQRPLSAVRVAIAMILVGVLLNIVLNTVWLDMMGGKGFLALLPLRIGKNLMSIPLNAVVFYLLAKPLSLACTRMRLVKFPVSE